MRDKRVAPRAGARREGAAVDEQRRRLMSLCYRLLGSVADAEDAVQEAYARWYALPEAHRAGIASPTGWLVTVASRICLDMLGSARARRERYVGEWLPEPVSDQAQWTSNATLAGGGDPADRVTLDESVTMAFLVVLDAMTPAERVAFVLHDVFRFTFDEIGGIVGRTPPACRQLASSARRRLRAAQPSPAQPSAARTPAPQPSAARTAGQTPANQPPAAQSSAARAGTHAEIVAAFKTAWQAGDLAALVGLLDPAAIAITDGGGLVSAALEPIHGAAAIADFFVGVFDRQPDLIVQQTRVNGQPGLVAHAGQHPLAVVAFEVAGGRIGHIWAVRNPEKLTAWR